MASVDMISRHLCNNAADHCIIIIVIMDVWEVLFSHDSEVPEKWGLVKWKKDLYTRWNEDWFKYLEEW